MKISILIACLNDEKELLGTIASAEFHATGQIEIIVVDDASSSPIVSGPISILHPDRTVPIHHLYRNKRRLGVGPSRHIAACLATGDILFIVDSHCRFTPGWDTELRASLDYDKKSLICGSMIGFDSKTPFARGKPYFGATWNFAGKDQKGKPQFFECVWQPEIKEGSYYAIPAPMGACYGMMRSEYLRLGGLQYLRGWGCDEQVLSLKFWLGAGGVVLNKKLTIGHKFRIGKERVPFPVDQHSVMYNKLFAIYTLLPENKAKILADKIPGNVIKTQAMKALFANWGIVEAERHHNIRLAGGELDQRFSSFIERFGLGFPTG